MDNASKALIIAGGILISVMVISVALYIIASARGVAYEANSQAEIAAADAFNRYYKSFGYGENISIKGIDAINIYSKALDDNQKYENHDSFYRIDVSDVEREISDIANGVQLDEGSYYSGDYIYSWFDENNDNYIDKITINKSGSN